MEWIAIADQKPDPQVPVIGYSKEWKDGDYNPKGIRECFRQDTGEDEPEKYYSALWLDYQDTYLNDEDTLPTHWMPYPEPPKQL